MGGNHLIFGNASNRIILDRGGDAVPVWRWWGGDTEPTGLPPLADVRPAASFALNSPVPLTLVPTFGSGWFGAPALRAHRGGRSAGSALRVVDVAETANDVCVELVDDAGALALTQRIAMRGDCLVFSAALVNHGDSPLDVEWLASGTLPLPADSATIRSFTGRHNAEFAMHDEAMPAHGWVQENRRGLTGHAGPPGLFVLGEGAGWHDGRVHAAQLAWSGNHRLAIERDDAGGWVLQMGEALAPGEMRLERGARYETPEMLVACSTRGLNGATQAFHAAVRARTPWHDGVMKPRPVHINSWEGFYFDHDEAALMALADGAADLGIERFVLDDGWFKGRHNDRAALGDWTADLRKYADGLGPLAAHVTALGMEFGLWVEPEMVSPDSDLFRAHPDWAFGHDRVPLITARNQLVLDCGRADVRDYLFDCINGLLGSLPIAYLKWDHNRDLAPAIDAEGRAGYRGHVLGTYALIDRIRAAHPAIEIEACAGGGGRIDAGIAARTHRFWTSDCIDAVSRVTIQRGLLHFMPPELMGSHVGTSPAHSTGRSQSMAFRAAVATPGHFGVELDPARMNGADREELRGAIARYKRMRDRLHSGRVWMGEAPDGLVWQAHGTPDDLLLFVTRVQPTGQRFPPALRLPMLADSATVRVTLLDLATAPGHPAADARAFAAMRDTGLTLAGNWLAEVGLPMPAMKAESVAILSLVAA